MTSRENRLNYLFVAALFAAMVILLSACAQSSPTVAVTTETMVEEATEAPVATEEAAPIATEEAAPVATKEEAAAGQDACPQMGGTLDIAMGTEPLSFYPPTYKATTDLIVSNLIYDGLVAFDKELNIIPELATEWERIDDVTWQFKLRDDVTFSDGSDFTAEDVKVSLEKGAPLPRAVAYIGFIDHVDIIDDYTVNIVTAKPFAPFLPHMASQVAIISSADHLQSYTDDELGLNPLGTGPYKLAEFVPGQRTEIVRNESYWGDIHAQCLDSIVWHLIPEEAARYAALLAGDVDVIENPPPHEAGNITSNPDFQIITSPATRDVRMGFQMQDELIGGNRALRLAVAHAIDAKSIVEFVVEDLARFADNGWAPPEVFTPDPPIFIEYNPELAEEYLVEAGYPGGEGLQLELRTPNGRYLRDKEIAQAIQQQLGEVGIQVELLEMEWGAYVDSLFAHEGQLFILGWGAASADPALPGHQNWYSTDQFNWGGYQSEEMDQILDEAEQTFDEDARHELYQHMTELLLEEDIVLKPIYWKLNLFAASSKVHDFVPNPVEMIDTSTTWMEQ